MSKKKTSEKNYKDPSDYYKDFYDWPAGWVSGDEDLKKGNDVLAILAVFIQSIIDDGFAVKTIKNHMGNLNLLGAEIFGRGDNKDFKLPAKRLLLKYIDGDGGPFIPSWDPNDHIEVSYIKSFDSSCNKLYKFILSQK
jgi:hypothetical protein